MTRLWWNATLSIVKRLFKQLTQVHCNSIYQAVFKVIPDNIKTKVDHLRTAGRLETNQFLHFRFRDIYRYVDSSRFSASRDLGSRLLPFSAPPPAPPLSLPPPSNNLRSVTAAFSFSDDGIGGSSDWLTANVWRKKKNDGNCNHGSPGNQTGGRKIWRQKSCECQDQLVEKRGRAKPSCRLEGKLLLVVFEPARNSR